MTHVPSAAVLAAALGLAVLAPAAAAQDPAVMLEAAAQAATNPHESAISDQYREIEAVVTEALPTAAAPEPAAPPPEPVAAPEPEYHPEPEQYHSETTSQVTVTQTDPQNVNVSIRINSPGDDGPVTQVNATGPVSVSVSQPARPNPVEPAASPPQAPSGAGEPDSWEWMWTSACLGGPGGGPAAAAASSSRWIWRWSCGEALPPALEDVADEVAAVADEVRAVAAPGERPAWPSTPVAGSPGVAPPKNRSAARARPERSGGGAGPLMRERPPPPAPSGGVLTASAPAPPAVPAVDHSAAPPARPKAQARARDDAGPVSDPGDGGGLAAGPASGLGGAISFLLAGWLAVLAGALGLALPRLWTRRWSGPAWRIPLPRSTRLERPG